MCVILVGKVGRQLHEMAKNQNPDGFSCFTRETGLVKNPDSKTVNKALDRFGVWHYRIRSSGKVDKRNIHPFPVAKGSFYLYHNGVLGEGTSELSDTNCFARMLYEMPIESVKSAVQAVSEGNRLLLVNATNPLECYFYGKWFVDSGIMLSHRMYKTYGSYAQKAGWSSSFSLKDYSQSHYDDDEDGLRVELLNASNAKKPHLVSRSLIVEE